MAGKKDKVKDVDRYSIFAKNLNRCFLCGSRNNIEWHEVFYGTSNRKKSKEDGTVAPLCYNCHRGQDGVHNNKEKDIQLKIIAQRAWEKKKMEEENLSQEEVREMFIARFGRNYIMED